MLKEKKKKKKTLTDLSQQNRLGLDHHRRLIKTMVE